MDGVIQLFGELAKQFGPMTAFIAGAAYLIWTKMPARAVQEADSEGKVGAIEALREMLADERAAHAVAEARADAFAKERNEAYQQLYELKGQLSALNRQMEEHKSTIEALTNELRQLKEKLNAA